MYRSIWFAVVALVLAAGARAQVTAFPDAAATDPAKLGWMQGSPPPPQKRVLISDGSAATFPQMRWSLSHQRELMPTVAIARGDAPARPFPVALRRDLDAVSFTPIGAVAPMTWGESLAANYTDGIVVLHKGRIVYERYFGALEPTGRHAAFSVSKSVIALVVGMLIEEGKLDPSAKIGSYLPEMAGSAFADATLRQALDMTTALKHTEVYADPKSDTHDMRRAAGRSARPPGYAGPTNVYDYLPTIAKAGAHGLAFAYRTPNTEVLGWLVHRVTGVSPARLVEERLWTRMGMEQDAYFLVDPLGKPLVGSGLNLGLRDLARIGEMMRLRGRLGGKRIVPESVVDDIMRGASKEDFAKAGYATLPGWSYRNQWWVSHDDHGVFAARGIHGQAIYVDPKAEMVIARFASHPVAGNVGIDPTSLPAYRAVATHLMGK